MFRHRRMVEFADTDMAGIMHFAAFFRFMESAEHALLRSAGLSVHNLGDGVEGASDDARVSAPRVSARCDFRRPARCEDLLDVEVEVARLGTTSVTYRFRFLRDDEELAVGEMTSVCCRMVEGRPPEPVALPSQVVRHLTPHVAAS